MHWSLDILLRQRNSKILLALFYTLLYGSTLSMSNAIDTFHTLQLISWHLGEILMKENQLRFLRTDLSYRIDNSLELWDKAMSYLKVSRLFT